MADHDTFTARSRLVRQSAQAHLRSLRQARRKRRAASGLGGDEAASVAIAPSRTDPDIDDAMADVSLPPDRDETDPSDPSCAAMALPSTPQVPEVEEEAVETSHEEADQAEPGATAETSDPTESVEVDAEEGKSEDEMDPAEATAVPPDAGTADAPDGLATDADGSELSEPVDDIADSAETPTDLDRLPGIGPGLIWMLQNAGIASLSDLAKADTPTLASKLGLVGELLDLDHWQALAADLIEDHPDADG